MKKIIVTMALAVGILISAGCERVEEDPMQKYREGYEATANAVTITQQIEVKRERLAVYVYEKEYEKVEEGYEVRTEEKRLNKVDAETEEAYTVVSGTEKASAAEMFYSRLTLETEAFESGYEISETSLRATLREDKTDAFFGLTGAHAAMENVELTITLAANAFASLSLRFRSGEYTVSILVSYAY